MSSLLEPSNLELFVEIEKPDNLLDNRSKYVPVYIGAVEPKKCGPLVSRLAVDLPLGGMSNDLSHLKRVKRSRVDCSSDPPSESQEPLQKRAKNENVSLDVVIGLVSDLNDKFATNTQDESVSSTLQKEFDLKNVTIAQVPNYLPESEEEFKEFNAMWPTAFFPNQTKECRQRQLELNETEIRIMQRGVEEAMADARKGANVGVIVMTPEGQVISRSSDERSRQGDPSRQNPLATSIIFAIQGVSRLEREHAIKQGMDCSSFQNGQYLCTGYDVYCTLEPTVFEAMACVHARIRRLVYGCSSRSRVGGLSDMSVHGLRGTNHKYRVFACRENSRLWEECRKLVPEDDDHEHPCITVKCRPDK